MATYLKPTSKLFDLPSRAPAELNLSDLMCPVCRGILIEPVTLPCAHSLCLRCLNGTIQHNSLSCPLCRVRVGSWLRTATKSATLVNDGLWKSIKARFSKEIQAKHDGEDTDLDSGYVTTNNKYLSAAGEIRREYEAQLQLAEEEMRRRREAERIASEALIRQIQAEERERMNQLAKDTVVAKNLAKKNLGEKVRAKEKRQEAFDLGTGDRAEFRKSKEGAEWDSNIALISKLRAESYASDNKPGTHHQAAQSYMPKPSCSNSKIYGTQIKEELHVPSDVLSRKKKSLGVEVCLATGESDRRIGSAESSGSHDSINIEIHHFKPIKAMPRTPLRTMPDGRQIDPKLIRVVAMLKRVQNAVLKPPTPMQLKRLSGCSYSAFKGKSKKVLKQEERLPVGSVLKEVPERGPSTSSLQSQQQTNSSKLGKSQISETVRRLDLSSEISYDGNKNYAKNINRIINGTKVSKKLILDEEVGSGGSSNATNGDNPGKFRRRKQNSSSNEREESESDRKVNDSEDEAPISSSTNNPASLPILRQPASDESEDAEVPAVENIAERIKKRKISRGRNTSDSAVSLKRRRVAEKKTTTTRKSVHPEETQEAIAKGTGSDLQQTKGKHHKLDARGRDEDADSQTESMQEENSSESPVESMRDADSMVQAIAANIEGAATTCSSKRSTRNSAKGRQDADKRKTPMRSTRRPVAHRRLDDKNSDPVEEEEDEDVREQKRLEELLLQEKKDFELAQRLQAKFDEMERISGRTRGSRRGGGVEVVVAGFNSRNIDQVFSDSRTVRSEGVGLRDRFSKQLLIQDEENSARGQTNKRRVTRRRCV